MRGVHALLLALVACAAASAAAAAPHVVSAAHTPEIFDPAKNESVTIHLRLSEAAPARVHIYDPRSIRVRTLAVAAPAERSQVVWDGRDERGRRVPPEAYVYAVETTGAEGKPTLWDPTDEGDPELFAAEDIVWDPQSSQLRYRLPHTARIRIRIGLRNEGPLLRTLLDWVPRAAGDHVEAWDGTDANGVLDLAQHPALAFVTHAFPLSRSTILVGPPPRETILIEDPPEPRELRPAASPARKRMFDYAHQSIEDRRDFPIRLEPAADLERTPDGTPIVDGLTPVRLFVDPPYLERLQNERYEAVFFVDGQYAFENEVAFLPTTWSWDPRGLPDGRHYLSANIRGFEGHFGMTTIEFLVRNRPRETARRASEPPHASHD